MKKKNRKNLYGAVSLLAVFILWTAAVQLVDVQRIGPKGSAVGFAAVNGYIHELTGVHMWLYTMTDWLSLVPAGFLFGFGLMGLVQWIRRKSIRKVDYSILILGGFYIAVMAAYLFFEQFPVNYRPLLIGGVLEASYPSSTTMLVMCVMLTAAMQLKSRIKNRRVGWCMTAVLMAFTVFMVLARLISGVHWFTDIVGGLLLSSGLVMTYVFISNLKQQ